jgi:imidazole glycerol phosphate synthase subunit HisF
MINTLLDISTKIEQYKVALLTAVGRSAKKLNIPFFVMGAVGKFSKKDTL